MGDFKVLVEFESITYATDIDEDLRFRGIFFKLFTEASNQYVDRASAGVGV